MTGYTHVVIESTKPYEGAHFHSALFSTSELNFSGESEDVMLKGKLTKRGANEFLQISLDNVEVQEESESDKIHFCESCDLRKSSIDFLRNQLKLLQMKCAATDDIQDVIHLTGVMLAISQEISKIIEQDSIQASNVSNFEGD